MTDHQTSLADIDQQQLDRIVAMVPGGIGNVQAVYPLAPLQEGILFHRLLGGQNDPYVLSTLFEVHSGSVGAFIVAVQKVIDRHDALRTALLWDKGPRPVQVVCRQAELTVEERTLDQARDPVEQLNEAMRPGRARFDLQQAPLLRVVVVASAHDERIYALLHVHHVVCDHQSLRTIVAEVLRVVEGSAQGLSAPQPYREYVARALSDTRRSEEEVFFRTKIGAVDEPTSPFDLFDTHGDGSQIEEARHEIDPALAQSIRLQARRAGVSAARIFHAAWALVVAGTSGKNDIVYGTVVLAAGRRGHRSPGMVGMFVNTLPLRLQLHDLTAKELVARTDQELRELLEYEHTSLAFAQRCSGIASTAPLFTALLNYRHSELDATADRTATADVRVLARGEAWSNYPIALTVDDLGDGFALIAQTDRRIHPVRVARYLEAALESLTKALERDPDQPALRLSILPNSERRQLVEAFNATDAPFPREQPTHALFEEQARLRPDALAVLDEGQSLTYAELNGKANQLARYLRRRGVAPGDRVATFVPRSMQLLICQLAVLKCGGVYVPLDPELPVERRTFMLRDCGARLILVDGGSLTNLAAEPQQVVDCAAAAAQLSREPAADLNVPVSAEAAAYVMYTSGSTGLPKGVVVPHRAVNRLAINNGYARIGHTDCIAHHSNPTFDASTFEIWTALLNGARIAIVPHAVVLDGRSFARALTQAGVTAMYMSVGLFNQHTDALAEVFSRLRYLLVGGDALDPGTIRRVLQQSSPQHLLNVYGPTECTTFATQYVIHAVEQHALRIPIGSPISNTRIYITDSELRPVPIGVAGEIYIGGAGVALGYLNRPELTAERFLQDPFSADPCARLYRTGDLGRWLHNGTIDYLGRNDQQVKIRGFRVEPAEIEAQLRRDARVRDAVVIAREDAFDDKQLVAYVVPSTPSDALTVEAMRAHLKTVLPEYMMPSAFVVLERLPLTANGKVERRALPAPEIGAYMSCEYQAPQGQVEEMLAQIWQQLLHVARVGRNYDFFEIGGNSLTVTRLIVRVAETFAIRFHAQAVFRSPTLAAMAQVIAGMQVVEQQQAAVSGDFEVEEGVL